MLTIMGVEGVDEKKNENASVDEDEEVKEQIPRNEFVAKAQVVVLD